MVFPVWDDNPFKRARYPYVTWGLIALNVAIFLIGLTWSDPARRSMFASFGATPAIVTHHIPFDGGWPPSLTLVTSLFLHGGWDHIIGNMVYLWVFGDDIEDALGPVRFLGFYLLSGVAAAGAHIASNVTSVTPLIGASGAVSGVLAAYLLLRPCAKVSVFVLRMMVRMRACYVIGAWAALQVWSIATHPHDGVAYLAHAGGLLAGALLFLAMRPAGVRLLECVEQPGESSSLFS